LLQSGRFGVRLENAMLVSRWAVTFVMAFTCSVPLLASAVPYAFSFAGNAAFTITWETNSLSTIPEGSPLTLRGAGDTARASQTTSGGAVTLRLTLDELTFLGFPLADRTLQYTSNGPGQSALCMAGTCVALADALPASWWGAPTPLDVMIARTAVTQSTSTLALEPHRVFDFSGRTIDIGAGGAVRYDWLLQSFAFPFNALNLNVIAAPVPEPGTYALLGAGLLLVRFWRRALTSTA
jgi:PEP-CTERM motif-containing protein